jgi:hypothetical protein
MAELPDDAGDPAAPPPATVSYGASDQDAVSAAWDANARPAYVGLLDAEVIEDDA